MAYFWYINFEDFLDYQVFRPITGADPEGATLRRSSRSFYRILLIKKKQISRLKDSPLRKVIEMTEKKNENIELRIEPATPENVTQLENIEQEEETDTPENATQCDKLSKHSR